MSIIYFLQRANGDIKIGTTKNQGARFAQLALEHGSLKLLGTLPGSYETERQLHEHFAGHRRKGTEFFAPCDELLEFIRENTTAESIQVEIDSRKSTPANLRLKNRVFRFTDTDMKNIKIVGERLMGRGIFGIQSPSGEINMTAVLRYLIHQQLQQLKAQNNKDV